MPSQSYSAWTVLGQVIMSSSLIPTVRNGMTEWKHRIRQKLKRATLSAGRRKRSWITDSHGGEVRKDLVICMLLYRLDRIRIRMFNPKFND
jgi:hypothetical protein